MITPAIMARVRKYAKSGDTFSIFEILDEDILELVAAFETSVKLCAKAMTGGNITRDDTATMSRLCGMIGHEP